MALPQPPLRSPERPPMIVQMEPLQKKEPRPLSRVVQTTLTQKLEQAPEADFLGKQNQKVERQTVSRRMQNADHSEQAETFKKSVKSSAERHPSSVDLSHFGVPLFSAGMFAPAQEQREWVTPGTRPEDYVPGMTQAGMTALNTREFVFYGYFQRVRGQLDRAWVPILRERLNHYFRAGRQLASDMDHTTRLFVVMNDRGEILRVQIQGESGVRDLDEAAIAAFNKAGPFPNPPKGMVDGNHEVKIAWDFILKT